MSSITTTIEHRLADDLKTQQIIARRPCGARVVLIEPASLETGDAAEAAIRRAYAMGREDERRQTSAVLRSLMSA